MLEVETGRERSVAASLAHRASAVLAADPRRAQLTGQPQHTDRTLRRVGGRPGRPRRDNSIAMSVAVASRALALGSPLKGPEASRTPSSS